MGGREEGGLILHYSGVWGPGVVCVFRGEPFIHELRIPPPCTPLDYQCTCTSTAVDNPYITDTFLFLQTFLLMHGPEMSENSNLKTLFYKNCSLGSIKNSANT